MDSDTFSEELKKLRQEMTKARHSQNEHLVGVINEMKLDHMKTNDTVDALTKTVAELKGIAEKLEFMASQKMDQIEKDIAENKKETRDVKSVAYDNERKLDLLEKDVKTLLKETENQGIKLSKHNNYLYMGFGAFFVGQLVWNFYKHFNG